MKLENITVSKRSQSQKATFVLFRLPEMSRTGKPRHRKEIRSFWRIEWEKGVENDCPKVGSFC